MPLLLVVSNISGAHCCRTFWEAPIIGHGLGSTSWATPNLRGEMLPVGHPHSAYLGVLLDWDYWVLQLSELSSGRYGKHLDAYPSTMSIPNGGVYLKEA